MNSWRQVLGWKELPIPRNAKELLEMINEGVIDSDNARKYYKEFYEALLSIVTDDKKNLSYLLEKHQDEAQNFAVNNRWRLPHTYESFQEWLEERDNMNLLYDYLKTLEDEEEGYD